MAITSPPPTLPPSPHRQTGKLIGLAALLFGVTIIITIICFGSLLLNRAHGYETMAKTLPSETAEAKREGVAITPADLKRNPPLSESQNAAPIYTKIDALYKQRTDQDRKAEGEQISAFLKPTRTENDRTNAKAILVRNAEIIHLGEQAATKPDCDFNRPWELGVDTPFPELAAMRNLARLLAARAILKSENGQAGDALDDVALGAHIAVHADKEGTTISLLVRLAIEAIMNRPFVEILQKHGTDMAVLKQAQETEKAFGATPDLRSSLRAELVEECATMEIIRRDPSASPDLMKDLPLLKASPEKRAIFTDAWESRMIEFWRQMDRGMSASNGDLLVADKAVQDAIQQDQSHRLQAGYEMNAMLTTVFDRVPSKVMQLEAQRRLRAGMVDLLEYRAAKGSFPEALSALPTASTLLDPFTDTPLLYRKEDTGFILYSVGLNRKDDGGDDTIDKNDEKNFTRDIIVRYPK